MNIQKVQAGDGEVGRLARSALVGTDRFSLVHIHYTTAKTGIMLMQEAKFQWVFAVSNSRTHSEEKEGGRATIEEVKIWHAKFRGQTNLPGLDSARCRRTVMPPFVLLDPGI